MSLAVPAALLLGALTLPIVGLYILRVRLRRVPVSTNLFWKQVYDEKPPRWLWRRLRHLLSLLIQLLLLWLLVLAVADPQLAGHRAAARRIVIVLDPSASMQATDVAPSRFEAAREAARQLLAGLRLGDEVAIVLAGSRPEVVLGMTGHVPTLRRALDAIAVSDSPANLPAAVGTGRQLIGNHPRGQLLVLTDGCMEPDQVARLQGTDPLEPEQEQERGGSAVTEVGLPAVDYRIFGGQAGNVGITRFQARRSAADPLGYELLVTVQNASATPVRCRLEITLGGAPVDILPLRLKADETWSRTLEKTSREGGRLAATLTQIRTDRGDESGNPGAATSPGSSPAGGSDAVVNHLLVDDAAWAILPPRRVQPVLIVTPGNLFLQKVFEANPLVQVQVRRDFPEIWPAGVVLILHRHLPPQLPPGDVLVIDPLDGCDLWQAGETVRNPIVADQDHQSPLMAHLRLENVLLPEARRLQFSNPPRVLAGTLDGIPLYAQIDRDGGKCLLLNVDLDRSDLAFRTAFPILVANAMAWFGGQRGEFRESLSSGGTTHVAREQLEHGGDLWLTSPAGQLSRLALPAAEPPEASPTGELRSSPAAHGQPPPADAAPAVVGPLNQVGVWTVGRRAEGADELAQSGDDRVELAVNLADERESDLRTPPQWADHPQRPLAAAGWLGRPVWYYLAMAACVLTIVEWLLYQRRWIS